MLVLFLNVNLIIFEKIMDIKKLFRDSYDSLSGNWGKAIVVTLIYGSIFSVIGFILGILSLFLQRIFDLNPLQGELLTNLISWRYMRYSWVR